jgi:hypothetical protein
MVRTSPTASPFSLVTTKEIGISYFLLPRKTFAFSQALPQNTRTNVATPGLLTEIGVCFVRWHFTLLWGRLGRDYVTCRIVELNTQSMGLQGLRTQWDVRGRGTG